MQIAQKNFYKKFLGRAGEVKAADYLRKKGYTVLKTNYKTHCGEIDIIAQDKSTVVFVEVKTRINDDYGSPAEAITKKKIEKYARVAQEYLIREKKTECECRFDVIEIENGQINHILDAFYV